jgi:hypothetical protein
VLLTHASCWLVLGVLRHVLLVYCATFSLLHDYLSSNLPTLVLRVKRNFSYPTPSQPLFDVSLYLASHEYPWDYLYTCTSHVIKLFKFSVAASSVSGGTHHLKSSVQPGCMPSTGCPHLPVPSVMGGWRCPLGVIGGWFLLCAACRRKCYTIPSRQAACPAQAALTTVDTRVGNTVLLAV